jgi:hypothetical protein
VICIRSSVHLLIAYAICLQAIATEESISAMPTFRVYKHGRKVDELIGASKEKLEQLIATNA